MDRETLPKAVIYNKEGLFFLDQTRLPFETVFEKQETAEQIWRSIKELKVRGAPAIGIAGAYGLLISVKNHWEEPLENFKKILAQTADYLNSSRPTAVNLSVCLKRMIKVSGNFSGSSSKELYDLLEAEAETIRGEDAVICEKIGENGAELIKDGMGVLTHCNAGALAVSQRGTALAPIYEAHERGKSIRVYADETRPLLQGARLTAWELKESGVDVTLICDDMAAFVMSKGLIDLVIVGCDRVAANGDVANKIGTLGVAVLAGYFGVPTYVACPSSTYDFDTKTGEDIIIEERGQEEVTGFGGLRTAPYGIKALNPAFDVTPARLIKGFITEKGIIGEPFHINLSKILGCRHG